jgi:hypothetical protein
MEYFTPWEVPLELLHLALTAFAETSAFASGES